MIQFGTATDLAERFFCPLNAVAMYLLVSGCALDRRDVTLFGSPQRRKRRKDSGIYQATGFKYKVRQQHPTK
jgi:hypothetical protein